jgi:MFS family permease
MININILKKLNSNVYYVGLIGFLMNFSATLVYTTLLIFVGGNVNIISTNNMVVIRSLSDGLANFSKIFGGFFSDKFQNRKSFLFLGYGSMIFVKIAFAFLTFDTIKSCLPIMLLQGVFIITQIFDRSMNAVRDPARDAILMECSSRETRGIVFGVRKFLTSLGSICGGLITIILIYYMEKNSNILYIYEYILAPAVFLVLLITAYFLKNRLIIFFFGLILCSFGFIVNKINISSLVYLISTIPVILTLFVIKKKIQEPKSILNNKFKIDIIFLLKNFKFKEIKNILLLLVLMSLLSFGKLTEYHIFNMGMSLGLPSYYIPIMFTILYIIITVLSYVLGYFLDKKYNYLILMISVLSVLVGNYFLSISTTLFYFWIGLVLNGVFLAANDSIFASIISIYIPKPEIKATIFGLIYGISGFMALFNSLIILYLNSLHTPYQVIYKLTCIPIFVGFILLLFNYKNLKHNEVLNI